MSIEAMKQALNAMLNFESVIVNSTSVHKLNGEDVFGNEILALGKAIEQAEKQKPMLWAVSKDQAEFQEFVSKVQEAEKEACEIINREWVGLTKENVVDAYISVSGREWAIGGLEDALPFARAIEAKLKEKNYVS